MSKNQDGACYFAKGVKESTAIGYIEKKNQTLILAITGTRSAFQDGREVDVYLSPEDEDGGKAIARVTLLRIHRIVSNGYAGVRSILTGELQRCDKDAKRMIGNYYQGDCIIASFMVAVRYYDKPLHPTFKVNVFHNATRALQMQRRINNHPQNEENDFVVAAACPNAPRPRGWKRAPAYTEATGRQTIMRHRNNFLAARGQPSRPYRNGNRRFDETNRSYLDEKSSYENYAHHHMQNKQESLYARNSLKDDLIRTMAMVCAMYAAMEPGSLYSVSEYERMESLLSTNTKIFASAPGNLRSTRSRMVHRIGPVMAKILMGERGSETRYINRCDGGISCSVNFIFEAIRYFLVRYVSKNIGKYGVCFPYHLKPEGGDICVMSNKIFSVKARDDNAFKCPMDHDFESVEQHEDPENTDLTEEKVKCDCGSMMHMIFIPTFIECVKTIERIQNNSVNEEQYMAEICDKYLDRRGVPQDANPNDLFDFAMKVHCATKVNRIPGFFANGAGNWAYSDISGLKEAISTGWRKHDVQTTVGL